LHRWQQDWCLQRESTGVPLLVFGEPYGRWLEMEVGLEILCNFVDKMLEGELPDEELYQFLVMNSSGGFHVVQ
jgi:hypothetical protein